MFHIYLLLVKMIPLRSEAGLGPPAFHPRGHLSYAVHPLVCYNDAFSDKLIILPRVQRHVRMSRKCSGFFPYLDSCLSVSVSGTSPSCGFITADAPSLKEGGKANVRVCFALRRRILPQRRGKQSSCPHNRHPPTGSSFLFVFPATVITQIGF